MSRSFQADIIDNTSLLDDVHFLRIMPDVPVMHPEPGQFYMLQAGLASDPLLKRPFSIFDAGTREISFLMKIRGKGTRLLSRMSPGSRIAVLGPLGIPYPVTGERPLVVAGGIGMASLFSLVKRLSGSVSVIYGSRTARELLFMDILLRHAVNVKVTTDDGSEGRKGTVLDALGECLDAGNFGVVYTCGPGIMMKKVSEMCMAKGVECYVSLEEHMACGIGSCLGCAVKTREGYRRVCKEGPVFSARDVVWGETA